MEKNDNIGRASRPESMAVFLSNLVLGIPVFHLGLFLTSTEGFNFMFYNLPDICKEFGKISYIVCAALEFLVVLTWIATTLVILLMEMICFLNMEAYLKCSAAVMKNNKQGNQVDIGFLTKAHEILRELQIFMQSFNEISKTVVFITKQLYLIVSVIQGFYAVRFLGQGNLWLGLIYASLFSNLVVIFPMCNELAFTIPDLTESLMAEIKLEAKVLSKLDYAYVVKNVDSIRGVEVRVGGFGIMDRLSVLDFLMEVVSRVTDLLIGFK
ncbi:unnamed protein product [Allacma fusca]|uniref:Uncharacterized protein n=1 Tax=Allacma fusca TaxID=39272 RepID=A0A8J2JLA0_9HEXA|nr:unnamed protein product [Allacma fusca]